MKYYSESITNLIEELASLPNIGPKSAQRLALHILNLPEARVKHLADSILTAKQKICFCKECFNLSDRELCQVCADEKRDHQTIMVVEEPSDLAAYEKTGQYKGVYHVLHGAVNPMVGVQPENLKLKELLQRLHGLVGVLLGLAAVKANGAAVLIAAAGIGGHDDDGVLKVDLSAMGIGDHTII